MSSSEFNAPPDDSDHDIVVEGIPLRQVVSHNGPILTCYMQSGPGLRDRVEAELRGRSDVSDRLVTVARTLAPVSKEEGAICIVANEAGPGYAFPMVDPITRDVFRVGTVPSLGSLVESASLLPSHAIVTVSEDTYVVASFGSSSVPSSELSTMGEYNTSAQVVSALGFRRPAKIIVAGQPSQSGQLVAELAEALPESLVSHHPEMNSLVSTESLADMVITSAASLRAELITLELGRFRAARDEGVAVEEHDVLDAVNTGAVSSVLVHDDPADDRKVGVDRLVDLITAGTIRQRLPLTLIPDVPEERGPRGGIGAILRGDATKQSVADISPEAVSAGLVPPGHSVAIIS